VIGSGINFEDSQEPAMAMEVEVTATAAVQAHPDTVKQSALLIIMEQEQW